jgi:phospholipid/cholesterol/gamma-HCH transport system permease protein
MSGGGAAARLGPALTGTTAFLRLKRAGEMSGLAVRSVRYAVTPPFDWLGEATVIGADAMRRCVRPLAISHGSYVVGFGVILFGGVIATLGSPERLAGGLWFAWTREICTWITMMVFAGVVGSSMAADIAARKIRDELDALQVLGIDQMRSLVLPRVLACTVAAAVLAVLSTAFVTGINYLMAPEYLHFSRAAFRDSLASFIYVQDIVLTMVVKNAILGFFVAVVACYKGLSSEPGTEGVGRAVNQCVVITFFGIWLFNSLFNLAYVSLLPNLVALKG